MGLQCFLVLCCRITLCDCLSQVRFFSGSSAWALMWSVRVVFKISGCDDCLRGCKVALIGLGVPKSLKSEFHIVVSGRPGIRIVAVQLDDLIIAAPSEVDLCNPWSFSYFYCCFSFFGLTVIVYNYCWRAVWGNQASILWSFCNCPLLIIQVAHVLFILVLKEVHWECVW